jgi:hypothetical protein
VALTVLIFAATSLIGMEQVTAVLSAFAALDVRRRPCPL